MKFDLPRPPSPVERAFRALRELHAGIEAETIAAGMGAEALPAWHAHLPSGQIFRIKRIGKLGPFIRFWGLDLQTTALVAPDAVSVTVTPIPREDDSPRFPIGFQVPDTHEEAEVEGGAGAPGS